jgi:hypothetical protein
LSSLYFLFAPINVAVRKALTYETNEQPDENGYTFNQLGQLFCCQTEYYSCATEQVLSAVYCHKCRWSESRLSFVKKYRHKYMRLIDYEESIDSFLICIRCHSAVSKKRMINLCRKCKCRRLQRRAKSIIKQMVADEMHENM